MKKKSIWFGSAAALILFACWLLMQSGSKPQSEGEITGKPKSARAASNDEDLARERTARRKASGRVLPEGSITTHQPEQLKDFVLTECKGHQVSLRTALKLIDEAYQDACYFSLEKPLKLKYEIDGESDKLLNFSLKGKTWLGAVKYVAALAGMEVKLEGEKVVLTPLEGADEVKEMTTIVKTDIIEELKSYLSNLGEWNLTVTSDPTQYLSELLRRNGIIKHATVIFDPVQGRLTIHGNAQELASLDAFMALSQATSDPINITTRILHSKERIELPQGNLDDAKMQEWLRDLMAMEGMDIMTAPSINSKHGHDVTIEVKESYDDNWTGIELNYKTDYIGLKMISANQTELRPKGDGGKNQYAEAQFLVYGGDSQVKELGNDSSGYYYQLTTLRPRSQGITRDDIDAILNNPNRPTQQGNHPIAKAVPGKPGFVFSPFNNHIVDLTGIAPGTLVADPQYPASEKKHFRAP
jgi:hypothetical protein